jgi:transcriptional regulator with XRE-family HTH domain
MNTVYEQVGRCLRERRTRAGMTQQALAERAGLSVSFVSFLESGRKKGSLETYQRLARALGIPLADLFRSGAPARWPRLEPASHLAGLNVAERQAIWRLVATFRKRRKG